MKKMILAFALVFSILAPALAQKNILVLERPGNTKNFKYFVGDKIELVTIDSLTRKGVISAINDSVFVLDYYTEVPLKSVAQIQRDRWALKILSRVMMIGGVGLIALEAVNGAISSDGNINPNTLYAGAGIAAGGILLIPLRKSHYYISPDQWKIKILSANTQFE